MTFTPYVVRQVNLKIIFMLKVLYGGFNMIQWEVIQGQDSIYQYKNTWTQLFDSGKHEPSTSFEWTHALISTTLKENDTFILLILRNPEEIIGIVPLVLSESRKYGLSIVHLFPISEYAATHSDILLKCVTDDLIEALISALSELDYRWDVFRMSRRLIETNPLVGSLERYLKKKSIHHFIQRTEPTFFITLDNSYNKFLEKKSSHFRNNLKRNEKKMHAMGDVDHVKSKDIKNVADAYNAILHIEENSWKHQHGTAITVHKNQREFFKEVCENAFEKGWLRLHFFYINKEPIAYTMGLAKNLRYYSLRLSYHEKFKAISPGVLLLARLIQDLIQEGISEFDFAGEPFEYEKQWTDELKWNKSIVIYNDTLMGRVYSIYKGLKSHKIKRSNDQNQVECQDPRNIKH
jgi:CelD/BcsL family acetyltransferase involved in cellulose biosynthesis